jgi:general secretion pathway protein G
MAEHSLNVAESRLGSSEGPSEDLRQRELFKNCAGFTLVELIVITVIIGVLAAIAIPAYSRFVEKTRVTRVVAEIRSLEKDILASTVEGNSLPNSLNDIGRGALRDPWGNFYQYLKIDDPGVARLDMLGILPLNSDFDLYSLGPDGVTQQSVSETNSLDDVLRAGNGGWIGLGTDF